MATEQDIYIWTVNVTRGPHAGLSFTLPELATVLDIGGQLPTTTLAPNTAFLLLDREPDMRLDGAYCMLQLVPMRSGPMLINIICLEHLVVAVNGRTIGKSSKRLFLTDAKFSIGTTTMSFSVTTRRVAVDGHIPHMDCPPLTLYPLKVNDSIEYFLDSIAKQSTACGRTFSMWKVCSMELAIDYKIVQLFCRMDDDLARRFAGILRLLPISRVSIAELDTTAANDEARLRLLFAELNQNPQIKSLCLRAYTAAFVRFGEDELSVWGLVLLALQRIEHVSVDLTYFDDMPGNVDDDALQEFAGVLANHPNVTWVNIGTDQFLHHFFPAVKTLPRIECLTWWRSSSYTPIRGDEWTRIKNFAIATPSLRRLVLNRARFTSFQFHELMTGLANTNVRELELERSHVGSAASFAALLSGLPLQRLLLQELMFDENDPQVIWPAILDNLQSMNHLKELECASLVELFDADFDDDDDDDVAVGIPGPAAEDEEDEDDDEEEEEEEGDASDVAAEARKYADLSSDIQEEHYLAAFVENVAEWPSIRTLKMRAPRLYTGRIPAAIAKLLHNPSIRNVRIACPVKHVGESAFDSPDLFLAAVKNYELEQFRLEVVNAIHSDSHGAPWSPWLAQALKRVVETRKQRLAAIQAGENTNKRIYLSQLLEFIDNEDWLFYHFTENPVLCLRD